MGRRGGGYFLVLSLILWVSLPVVTAIVAFVQPGSVCNGYCDGTLEYPFPTINAALEYLDDLFLPTRSWVYLFPGVYTGPDNTGLLPSIANIKASNPLTTIIDCQGLYTGFNLTDGFFWLDSLTVQNCVGVDGGGAYANYSEVYLRNTRWLNNSASSSGGALGVFGYTAVGLDGVNVFEGNSAAVEGGAIEADEQSFINTNGLEVFSRNSVNLTVPNNVNLDYYSMLRYPINGKPPPLVTGMTEVYPATYVDRNANCSASCTGTPSAPFTNLMDAMNNYAGSTHAGGNIYVMPGVYSGDMNCNLTLWWDFVITPWPGKNSVGDGRVVIDCLNLYWGMNLTSFLSLKMVNVTMQNCTTPEGGGALFSWGGSVILDGVNFIGNSARANGGAILLNGSSNLEMKGGGFFNNWAGEDGGAIMVTSSAARFTNGVSFASNRLNSQQNIVDDLGCYGADIQSDGTVGFVVGKYDSRYCYVTSSSPSTDAVFPGALNGVLYPKDRDGNSQSDIFAGLAFDSIVELDEKGQPIESTRLTRTDFTWTQYPIEAANYLTLEYDAFGPANQFVSVEHSFFNSTGPYWPLGVSNDPITVAEGVIKTSIQVAMWPFLSPTHSLGVSFVATTTAPITEVKVTNVAGDTTELTLKTSSRLVVSFSALDWAIYDGLDRKGPAELSTELTPTGIMFHFKFSYFQRWLEYDPQFGALLNDKASSEGDVDSGATPIGLIVGLSVGLTALACLIVIGVAVIGGGSMFAVKRFKRRKFLGRVDDITRDTTQVIGEGSGRSGSKVVPYIKMSEDL